MGDIIDDQNIEQIEQPVSERPAGQSEGEATEPSQDEIKALYEATGVKAPVPTGKTKGRPKASSVRAEDDEKKGTGNSDTGSEKDDDNKGKSKNAPSSSKDVNSGSKANSKKSEDGKDAGEVQDESGDPDKGVRDSKPKGEEDSERGGKDSSKLGAERTGQEAHDKDSEEEEGEDDAEGGKRPGKSNPEVEKRFQRLTQEKREREELIDRLQKQLQEKEQLVEKSKIAQEDPEYTIDDFRKVRDNEGNIIDLDSEQAELAWRRWQDGYNQRSSEREAKANHEAAEAERESEAQRQVIEDSVKAYDTLAELQGEYPELVSTSGKFDPDFAADAMPIIEESIEYLEGTEPGNPDNNLPIITGLRINPKKILNALKNASNKKRNLPLNGVNDNVEVRSNVAVPHSRSSDPTVHAANELMKELNINKRF